MNENFLVTKSNTLITSSYDLSLEEQRIILTLASMVQPTDEDFKPYKLNIKEFMELLGVEDKSKYTVIPKITKELMQKVFEIKNGNKITQVAWLSSAEYEKGLGTVELEFSPKLKPFMLGLKEFYTSYKLKNVLELKGKYSIRMYEILKSNEFRKNVKIELDDLRNILKVNKGSYLVYQNFKNRIIIQAQKELQDKTDISFEFEEIKTGKKVTHLGFSIKSNAKVITKSEVAATLHIDDGAEINLEEDIKELSEHMKEHNMLPKQVSDLYKLAKKNKELLKEVYNYCIPRAEKNLYGYMKNTLKAGYVAPIKSKSTDNFNNYEQRKYDFDELEAKLLGWK